MGDQTVSGGNPPCGIYPCKGGGPNDYVYVYTSRANPEHWKRLLQVIGREDLIGDARYESPAARMQHEAEIHALVSDWTKQHDKHEAMRLLGGAGIPAGAVLDTKELIDDPTFHDRGILQVMDHPVVKNYRMPAWPVRHDGAPPRGEGLAATGRAFGRGSRELARPQRARDRGTGCRNKVISRH